MWKEQCLAELQSRQKNADREILDQVNKIEEQRVTRQKEVDFKAEQIASAKEPILDKDLLQRQRRISEIREKYNLANQNTPAIG